VTDLDPRGCTKGMKVGLDNNVAGIMAQVALVQAQADGEIG